MQIRLTSEKTCGMCRECFKRKQAETRGRFRSRASAGPPENTMWLVGTLPESLPDAVGGKKKKNNLGSIWHSPDPSSGSAGTRALTPGEQVQALGAGRQLLLASTSPPSPPPRPPESSSLSPHTRREGAGCRDTYRASALRGVGGRLRWLCLFQPQTYW